MNVFTVVYPDGSKHGLYRYKDDAYKEANRLSRSTRKEFGVIECAISVSQYVIDRIK